MNPLLTTEQETFKSGSDNLSFFHNRLTKMANGALIYCRKGVADVTIDLQQYHAVPHTIITLLPGSIFSVSSTGDDFSVDYFAFSGEMMQVACFRFEPAFINFLKDSSCYTHTEHKAIASLTGLIRASHGIYEDRENRFRENIAQNLLQIFFLDTYDKVQRLFTTEQVEGSNRKGQLFKKFIQLVHLHCARQRDVTFYAEELCISTRYLSAITQQMRGYSAKEIIDEFLVLEIKVTLQSTSLSLKEIAELYHFPDQSFFGRYFKKHTGVSPKEYRAKVIL